MNMALTTDPCHDIVITCENVGFAIGSGSFLTYEQFDAVGDGIADDTIPIRQAVAASAAGGGPIFAAAKTYKVTGTVFMQSNAEIYNAAGTVYDMRDAPAGTVLFVGRGVADASVLATDQVQGGDTTVPVASGAEAGFTAGDMVKLWSDDIFDPARTDTRKGELNYVQSTTPGQVRLRTGSIDSYVTNVRLQKIAAIRNVRITGGTIHGDYDTAGDHYAVEIQYGEDCIIERLQCEGVSAINIRLLDCINSGIVACIVHDAANPTTGTAFAFGLASRACYLENSYARNMRHGFINTASVTEAGVTRDSRVVGNTFEDALSHGIVINANADETLVSDNTVNNPVSRGVSSDARRVRVIGNRVRRAGSTGLSLLAGTAGEAALMCTGNIVTNAGGRGVDITVTAGSPTPPGFYAAIVSGNRIEASGGVGVYISDTTGVSRNIEVQNNTLLDCAETLGLVGMILQGLRNFAVGGNIITGLPVNANGMRLLTCSKGNVIGNVLRFDDAATQNGIDVQDTSIGIVISGNTVDSDGASASGLRGVAVEAGCSNIQIGVNDFNACTGPVSPGSFTIAAGILQVSWTGPYVIGVDTEGGAALDDVERINGLPRGAIQAFAPVLASRDVKFKNAAVGGNLFLGSGGAAGDVTLGSPRDRIVFSAGASSELLCLSSRLNE